jgi:very-short-patch-repair endonuclease
MFIRRAYTKDIAKALRSNPTREERLVWSIVRNRNCCGLKFRRQHPIHPYVVDFICLELNIIIELDGAYHSLPEQRAYDLEREEFLLSKRFRIIRITNRQIKTCDIQALLIKKINEIVPLPLK